MSDTSPEPPLDAARIIETLNRHNVVYLVIGGVAGQAWATAMGVDISPTKDIDITPDADWANLDRLSDALHELGARIRSPDEPAGLPFDHDGASLGRARIWNLISRRAPWPSWAPYS